MDIFCVTYTQHRCACPRSTSLRRHHRHHHHQHHHFFLFSNPMKCHPPLVGWILVQQHCNSCGGPRLKWLDLELIAKVAGSQYTSCQWMPVDHLLTRYDWFVLAVKGVLLSPDTPVCPPLSLSLSLVVLLNKQVHALFHETKQSTLFLFM